MTGAPVATTGGLFDEVPGELGSERSTEPLLLPVLPVLELPPVEATVAKRPAAADDFLYGKDLFGETAVPPERSTLAKNFGAPPFSVLNAGTLDWQARKRAWFERGLKPDDGTREGVLADDSEATHKVRRSWEEYDGSNLAWGGATGSLFDPVLAELCCRWFCTAGGHILDPFAGESTKGLVAAALGYQYTGVELRAEQVAANNAQAAALELQPRWITGDSANLRASLPKGELYDFVFTSPPYYNLEQYKGGEDDGSSFASYQQFSAWHRHVLAQCIERLRPERFLCIKVGEVRDTNGAYCNYVGDTVRQCMELGLHYYNEIILVTPIGSLPIRAAMHFNGGRKVEKGHQNVLVFWKGDLKKIKGLYGNVI